MPSLRRCVRIWRRAFEIFVGLVRKFLSETFSMRAPSEKTMGRKRGRWGAMDCSSPRTAWRGLKSFIIFYGRKIGPRDFASGQRPYHCKISLGGLVWFQAFSNSSKDFPRARRARRSSSLCCLVFSTSTLCLSGSYAVFCLIQEVHAEIILC